MTTKVWHYSVGDDRRGPVAADELRQLAAAGDIGPDDLVWKQGMAEWVAASTVKGLFPKPPATGSKPVPPPLPSQGVPPPSAPLSVDDAEQEERPDKPKPVSFLQPVLQVWERLPTPGKIGVGGGLLLLLVSCCGGILFVGSRFMGGAGSALDAAELAREYDSDRKGADAKYKGKTLTVTGIIDIPYKGEGFATIHLEVPDGLKSFPMVTADFGAKYEADLQKLRRGDTIRFRGQCEGDGAKPEHGPSVHFINCELVSPGGSGGGDMGGLTRSGGTKANGKARKGLTQAELNSLGFDEIMDRLGPPSERYSARRQTNLKLAAWATGNGKFITMTYMEAIDGTSPTLIMTRNVDRPKEVVDNLKRILDTK